MREVEGLSIHEIVRRIGHDLREAGEGLESLGFHHRWVRARRPRHVTLLARWPSRQAMQHARDRIRELTDSRMPAVKNVGEPCEGEPHARFEVAAGGTRHQSAQPCGAGASRRPYRGRLEGRMTPGSRRVRGSSLVPRAHIGSHTRRRVTELRVQSSGISAGTGGRCEGEESQRAARVPPIDGGRCSPPYDDPVSSGAHGRNAPGRLKLTAMSAGSAVG